MTQTSLPLALPPKTQQDLIQWVRLIRSRRVGPVTFHRLIREHGTIDAAIAELPALARKAGVKNYAACPFDIAEAEVFEAQEKGYRAICYGTKDYPELLADTTDAPPLLWAKGNISCLTKPTVAIVGARNASSLGRRMTHLMAEGLADAGYSVISGLARGIDAAAHTASLAKGTIGVVAGGLARIIHRMFWSRGFCARKRVHICRGKRVCCAGFPALAFEFACFSFGVTGRCAA